MLPSGFIQELLSRVDVAEVVGRHVELKKAGINHKGLCPFHGEKSPSFIVSPSRQTYHCFGCGAHGDAIRFLTEHSGLGFMDAVRELSQQVGLTVPEAEGSSQDRARAAQEKAQRATLSEVLSKAGDHYRQALKDSPRAVDYLKKRGLTGQVAAAFGMGYAPEGWRTLASVFPQYDDPLLSDSGLVIVQGDEGSEQRRYDRFRDRIMFPIRSVRGEVIGFGGRVLDQGEPKYLNSPETPVFHKGQELYGLFEARQGLRAKGYALVVEGYMDVVALAQSGLPNAVATLGTACTAEHVAKLLRFTDAVVFSFDGDTAGRRAAGRALEAALPHANDLRSFRFLFLPAEHDPDSFVRQHGTAAFEQAVTQAVPLSSQLVNHCAADSDLDTAEGRARMLSVARPLVALMPEGLLREQLVTDLAQRGGIALPALLSHWQRQASKSRGAATAPDQHQAGSADPASPAESGSDSRKRWSGAGRLRPAMSRSAPPQTATLLGRCCWLLARHTAQWLELPAESQTFLAAEPAPYGAFFVALERVVHDQGAVSMAALVQQLRQDESDEALLALVDRISQFHDVEDDESPAVLLQAVLRRLHQRAVDDELQWLVESGELSDDATTRRNELFALRAALKTGQAVG